MTLLTESVEVARPIDEVFSYVSDFTTTLEWDPTVIRARKRTTGPVQVGTEFEIVCALPVGSVEILYTVVDLKPDKLIKLHGTCALFNIQDSIRFTPSGLGTRIDYQAAFQFSTLVAPFAGLAKNGLERMGRVSVASLGAALEGQHPITPSPGDSALANGSVIPELARFTRCGYRRGQKRFQPMSNSVKGLHMLITGASAGLGYATARELARRGAELTLVVRDRDKGGRVVKELQAESGNTRIHCEFADLSLMSEVDALVGRLNRGGKPIDVLINNAGALFNPRGMTAEGLEQSFALLLLSPYRLTEGLVPLLEKARAPRVINVVSGGMYSQKLDVDALQNTEENGYSGSVAYAREKRALMVLTEEWARDWAQQGIVVNAMHPGWADTPGVRGALPLFHKLTRPLLRSPQEGADTIVWLAVAREAGEVTGKLFLDRSPRATHLTGKTREDEGERRKLLEFLQGYELPEEASPGR